MDKGERKTPLPGPLLQGRRGGGFLKHAIRIRIAQSWSSALRRADALAKILVQKPVGPMLMRFRPFACAKKLIQREAALGVWPSRPPKLERCPLRQSIGPTHD